MKYLLLSVIIFVSACTDTINSWELQLSSQLCKDNGGVSDIYVAYSNSELTTVTCNNGKYFTLVDHIGLKND